MVYSFFSKVSDFLQGLSNYLSDLVPRLGAANIVLFIALTVPIFVLLCLRIWSALDRYFIRRRLTNEFVDMSEYLASKHSQLQGTDLYIASYLPPLSADCMRSLELSKRMCSAMRSVLIEMEPLISSGTEQKLLRAQALRFHPLELVSSPLETVQLDLEVPKLQWDEWKTRLDAVMRDVNNEINVSKQRRGAALLGSPALDYTRGIHAPCSEASKSTKAA